MISAISTACAAIFLLHDPAAAFAPSQNGRPSAPLEMTPTDGESRRSFFGNAASAAAAVAGANILAQFPAEPAYAFGGGLKKVNARLQGYGLPIMAGVPDGFSPLLEIWGKGVNREPLLVQFAHPIEWVVTLPSQDVNGEDGTIQAGEYGKGDTATFFVYKDAGKVTNIAEQPKDFFIDVLSKAISQKSANIYQDFKVTKIVPTKGEYANQDYVICDFKYGLLTGAGFIVERRAVAAVTNQGNAVEALWCAVTSERYKKQEARLRSIAGSFRVFSDGLDLVVPAPVDNDLA